VGEPSVPPVPWWQSPWSWIGGLLLLSGLLLGAAELRAVQLRARTRALEREVDERTRDLAERRATAHRQAERLASLAGAKDQVLARVSNEFSVPLAQVLEVMGALRRTYPAHADLVERNAQRLQRLVDQMRGLTRRNADGKESGAPAVAARALLDEVVSALEPAAIENGLVLVRGRTDDVRLSATSEAFETIAINLLSNAIKYTPAGGRVEVSLALANGEGVLEVRDNGRGIERESQLRVFEPFERAHDEGERIPGSGLGLALVKEQVEAHRGRIELDSEPGTGSVFRVFLPLAAAGPHLAGSLPAGSGHAAQKERRALMAVATTSETSPALPADPAVTVLIVEDHPDMRRYMSEVLAPHYRCVTCDDGREAVALARDEIPDVVISDILLPGQDGYAVCRALKSDERTCHVPVVLLTALNDQENRLTGYAALADDYLAKPFVEAELLLRVRNLLDLRAMLQRRCARDLRFERRVPNDFSDRDRALLSRLGRLLDRRHGEPGLDAAALAAELAMSERQLQRKLKALTGFTPGECLRDYRLLRARERLLDGARVGEAASASGFRSHAHFTACFTARFGCAPSEARERAKRRA
jgi:signal transduction histidine kinase/DNA-binding response OmpR family regulator